MGLWPPKVSETPLLGQQGSNMAVNLAPAHKRWAKGEEMDFPPVLPPAEVASVHRGA